MTGYACLRIVVPLSILILFTGHSVFNLASNSCLLNSFLGESLFFYFNFLVFLEFLSGVFCSQNTILKCSFHLFSSMPVSSSSYYIEHSRAIFGRV